MSLPASPIPPSQDDTRRRALSWETADWTTWRALARGLLEFDLRRLHRREGYGSTAQYADCELGVSPRHTAELLRIAKKLLDLPSVDRALCYERLTWERVVVLTKVAVPEHEAAWLERALEVDLGDLTALVERSAEGSAPPVAGDPRPQVGEAPLGGTAEAPFAPPGRGAAHFGGKLLHIGPRLQGQPGSGHLRPGAATGFWRAHSAPNVRQRPNAPPSPS